MDVIKSLQWRYATKKFDGERFLDDDKVELIKEAFNLTATSFGLQPVKLIVIKDKALQEQLVPYSMDQKQVAEASHLLVFCIEDTIDANYITTYFNRVKDIRSTPDEILKPFEDYLIDDFGKMNASDVENWSTKQAYLAMGNLMTVCAIEGIDACPMEGFSPKDYDTILNLGSKHLKSVLIMPVGYRAKDDVFADFKKVRKTLDNSVIVL